MTNRRFLFGMTWREFGRADRGNVAVIFALAALPLLTGVGVAMDYAKGADVRTHLQAVLDAAVLAGVREGSPSAQIAKAQSFFDGQQPEKFSARSSANFSVADGVLTGTAQAAVPTSIMALFGRETMDVSAKAAAAPSVTTSKVCILLLDQSRSQTLLANSGAKLNAPDCEIHVRTPVSPGIIINASVNLNVKRTCVKSSSIINNGGTVGNLEKSCDAISDPFAGKMPSVSIPVGGCTSANYNPDVTTTTLPAGNYCGVNFNQQTSVTLNPGMYGGLNFNGVKTVKLNPGLYIVKGGGWNVSSSDNGTTFTGTGVTIYYADASIIQFNAKVNVQLSPPTSGNYADIVLYEAPGLSQGDWVINGSSNSTLSGLVYLPSKNVTINAVSTVTADKATMVFASLILNNTNWTITPGNKAMNSSSSGGGARLLY